ncbi:MAG: M56 family metallopeptidase [Planctomycetaceae bacterium]
MANLFPYLGGLMADHSSQLVAALLHSLWIGGLAAVIVRSFLKRLAAREAAKRCAVAFIGLAITFLGTIVAWSVTEYLAAGRTAVSQINAEPRFPEDASAGTARDWAAGPAASHDEKDLSDDFLSAKHSSSELSLPASRTWQTLCQVLLMCWLAGAGLMFVRTVVSLLSLRSLVRTSVTRVDDPAGDALFFRLRDICQRLAETLKLRFAVSLAMTDRLTSPAVLGFVRPVVLIPAAMLTGFTAEQWELILAHELAHIRRHDAMMNLLQMLIECVLFFNPAVWWLSRQVRAEREASCDAIAASVTGSSVEFARVLLNVASREWQKTANNSDADSATTSSPMAPIQNTALLALADDPQPGSVRDRVTRLADPDRRTAPRLTSVGLLFSLIALVGTVVAVQKGSDLLVSTVGDHVVELLQTPERIDQLARLQQRNIGVYAPPGTVSAETPVSLDGGSKTDGPDGDGTADSHGSNGEKFEVPIRIRTDDGEPVPEGTLLRRRYIIRQGNSTHSTGDSVAHLAEAVPVFETKMSLPRCQFALGCYAEGYAPFSLESRSLFEASDAMPIEIVLQRGFHGRIRVIDQDGQPVQGAELQGGMVIRMAGSTTGSNNLRVTADDQGEAVIEHCAEVTYRLRISAAGYQRDSVEIELKNNEPATIVMRKALPTIVHVVDHATGQPVHGAVCVESNRDCAIDGRQESFSSSDPRASDRRFWNRHAESDAEGKLVLDQLNDDFRYTMAIVADGYGTVGRIIEPGMDEQTIRLTPPINVSGRISGRLSRLGLRGRAEDRHPVLQFENPLGGSDDENGELLSARVESDGTFTISDVVPGKIEFRLPDLRQRQTVDVSGPIRDLQLTISDTPKRSEESPLQRAAAAGYAARDVVLQLTGVAPSAAARGSLNVGWTLSGRNLFTGQFNETAEQSGEAHGTCRGDTAV